VLVFGGGYDATAEDASPPAATTMGNAVMVIDAMTGGGVRTLATSRSVPGAVALIDTDFDGYADRAYAVDMGGNVYRVDFETASGVSDPTAWTITRFAALSDDGATRKLHYAPDVVQTRSFTAILVGSGNREQPLLTTTRDRFYTLFDYKTTKGAPGAGVIGNSSLVAQGAPISLGTSAGCYLALDTSGEKVVTSAVSTGGYTYFSTNRPTPPSPNSCTNLGVAKAYRLPLFCGAPESIELAGGGLPPSPVIGDVEVQVPAGPDDQGDQTKTVPFIIGGFNAELSGLAPSKVKIVVDPTRRRLYWFTNTGH
jgi:type IV pilus assembly protein PilY1